MNMQRVQPFYTDVYCRQGESSIFLLRIYAAGLHIRNNTSSICIIFLCELTVDSVRNMASDHAAFQHCMCQHILIGKTTSSYYVAEFLVEQVNSHVNVIHNVMDILCMLFFFLLMP